MRIRRLAPPDRDEIAGLVRTNGTFNEAEVSVAMELVDAALSAPGRDYNVIVCDDECGQLVGYLCFGPTPMTTGTFDLYWVATRAGVRGRGVGTRLVLAMEAELAAEGGRLVRIETSQLGEYDAARSFYARLGYLEVGRIRDFYTAGDDLVTLAKRIDLPVELSAGDARPAKLA